MEQTRPSTSAVAAVPSAVRELVVAHLERVDEAAPGLIEMLYLTGVGDHAIPPGRGHVIPPAGP